MPFFLLALLYWLTLSTAQVAAQERELMPGNERAPRATALAACRPPYERALLEDILARNPILARGAHKAEAARARIPQARALPAPTVGVSLFALPPETRVGPQRLSLQADQRLPWRGKRKLRAEAAAHAAEAQHIAIDALALHLLTEARTTLAELAFLDQHGRIIEEEAEHLARHEEAARARYSAGKGPQQPVLRLQSAITQRQQEAVGLAARRAGLVANLNAMRDRVDSDDFGVARASTLPAQNDVIPPPHLDGIGGAIDRLLERARALRPELRAAAATIAQRRTEVALAERRDRPDVHVGLGYTFVDRRHDAAARLAPPEGNGDDILAFSARVALPIRRQRIDAELLEHQAMLREAEEVARTLATRIERDVREQVARLPLLHQQHHLLSDVLTSQAEEALRSAEIAYATSELDALDLLDAEHALFDVRLSVARTLADATIALARLEGALGGPLLENHDEP